MQNKIPSLQALRGLAALFVVVAHTGFLTSNSPYFDYFKGLDKLAFGVDIFFLLSGFVVYRSSLGVSGLGGVVDFYIKRIIRVVPLYWLYTILFLVFVFFLHLVDKLKSTGIDFFHIFSSLFFVPYPRPDDGRVIPFLGQGWSLNFEMFFYLCCTAGAVFYKGLRWLAIGVVLLVFLYCVDLDSFYYSSLVFEFYVGVLLSVAFDKIAGRVSFSFLQVVFFSGVLFLLLFMSDTYVNDLSSVDRLFRWGGMALGLMVLFLFFAGRVPSYFILMGDISYTLYLSHLFVFYLLIPVQRLFFGGLLGYSLFVLLSVIASVVVGYFLYKLIEVRVGVYLNSVYSGSLRHLLIRGEA